jgi:hypothetical protein
MRIRCSIANSRVTNSPTNRRMRPLWRRMTPERFQVRRKRTAWAARRFSSISPPRSLPAGNGNEPPQREPSLGNHSLRNTEPNWRNRSTGTHTNHDQKYWSTTVHRPNSICATVPKNTSPTPAARSPTVRRSEEIALSALAA